MKVKDIGEFGLIERLRRYTPVGGHVVKAIGDDCAVVKFSKDEYLLLTTDMMVEGVHFNLKEATPYQIGRKALAVALSDIAAMGGSPRDALISIGLNPDLKIRFVDRLYDGMKSLARRFRVKLVGGDIVRSRKLIVSVALTGLVRKKYLTLRAGARDNDAVMVTGTLGGSILRKHLEFSPRISEAQFLVKHFLINSMIDISDGLAQDLSHIAAESGLGVIIYERDIPISPSAYRLARLKYGRQVRFRQGPPSSFRLRRIRRSSEGAKAGFIGRAKRGTGSPLQLVLSGGEDYELLFTMPKPEARRLLKSRPKGMPTRVTMIGQMVKEPGVWLVDRLGRKRKLVPKGYRHF